jgi:4-amino-4-deoxychorismate lyase
MTINFNGEFIQEEQLTLDISTNRCFLYGDGVFESMLGTANGVRFWEDHYDRLVKSATAIRLDIQRLPGSQNLHEMVKRLVVENGITTRCRVKFQIWRTSKGLYNPDADDVSYIITVVEFDRPLVILKKRVKVIHSPRLTFTEYSSFKTCNSLPYVLASKERAKLGLDDVLLLDQKDRVAEFSSMNIFWFQKGKLFTPSLNTGCIAGVMRKRILDYCQKNKIKTVPALSNIDALPESSHIFGSNFSGIHPVAGINEWQFEHQLPDFMIEFIERELI